MEKENQPRTNVHFDEDAQAETHTGGTSNEEEANHPNQLTAASLPQSVYIKIIALILICIVRFGNYYCYDSPAALTSPIMKEMNVSAYEFEQLYAFYSWPNIILPMLGGFLIDSVFGLGLGTVLLTVIIFIGHGVLSVGALNNSYSVMKAGRFIFGIGGDALALSGNIYASAWFQGKILCTVTALVLTFGRVGSYAIFLSANSIFNHFKETLEYIGTNALGWTLMMIGVSTLASLMAAIVLGVMERQRANRARHGIQEQPKMRLRDITNFSIRFWLICSIGVVYYVAIIPFISIAQVFLIEVFAFGTQEAAITQGLPFIISAISMPVFGLLIDHIGRNIAFVTLASFITLVSHIILLLGRTKLLAYIGVVLLGCGFSLLCATLWPMIPLIMPLHQQGTALGITLSIQNLFVGLGALFVGFIVDNYGYMWMEIFFIGPSVASLMICAILWIIDHKKDKYLQMTISERKAFELTPSYREMIGNDNGYVQI